MGGGSIMDIGCYPLSMSRLLVGCLQGKAFSNPVSMKIEAARYAKVNDIIVDPGFGFSKDIDQNYSLLKNLDLLKSLDLPILVGLSRKSMIYKLLETTPDYALNGSTTLNTVALLNGASILRVHDVKEAMECIKITNQFNKQ